MTDTPNRDRSKLPRWADRMITDKDREIDRLTEQLRVLEENTGARYSSDLFEEAAERITVEGFIFPESSRSATFPIGDGASYEFVRITKRPSVGGRGAIKVQYNGSGDLTIRPVASNTFHIVVEYDRGSRVMD